jgi:hypothetical protein
MRIAILGWGSLIWKPNGLPMSGDWKRGGPVLPIEFSRVSSDGRLTLVIDDQHGVDVITRYVLSSRTNMNETVEDLRFREETVTARIGYTVSSEKKTRDESVTGRIATWSAKVGIDAVVWTALPSNFAESTGNSFSVDHAMAYLKTLPEETRGRALDYIRKAPEEVNTPLRRAVTNARMM